MLTQEMVANDVITLADLKLLANNGSSPCITIVAHIPTPFELSKRLKTAIKSVEKKLKDRRTEKSMIESLIRPVDDLAREAEQAGIWSNALILFRAPDVFRYFLLHRRVPEVESVDDQFHVRPLLSAITREQRFHLLGLSRQHIRLWDCTQHRAEERTLPASVPRDIRVWQNNRQPDHMLDNRSAGGPSVGSMKGVMFGTSTDREREGEYLSHFFKDVDKGINTLLRNDTARLLLAGVEYEVAIYRRVNAHPRLFEKAVLGSPDGLTDRELRNRAMDVVMQSPSELLEKALTDFEKHRDTGRISSDAQELLKAVCEGRVADLFFSQDDPREDLLNTAALQTVRQGGRAFALEGKDMPVQRELVAVMRY
jgi:Bacterial archaeo-eukaryotic release factor family 3